YTFLRNSPYYGNLPPGYDKDTLEQKKNEVCSIFTNNIVAPENTSLKEICEKFMYMYNYLNKINKSPKEDKTITDEDCHFMNYWLNVNLRDKNIDEEICVNDFYEKLKSKDTSIFSSTTKLEDHLHVIESGHLKNMQLLYELYDTKQKITDIMFDEDVTVDKKELCQEHLEKCYHNYIEGMNNCLYGYDDFYEALKLFERDYKYLTEKVTNESGYCKISENLRLPENDLVLDEKQRRIMTTKIMSTPLILLFVIPLLYK
ncbi:PIR Superfamily Protein, partial [Plasmodium ovale curtisi]